MTRAGVYRCMNEHCVTYREPAAAPGRCSSCGEYRLAPPDARPIIWIDGVPVDVDTVLGVATELRDAGALSVYSPSDSAVEGTTWDAEPDVVHPSDAGCDAMASAMLQVERSRLLGALASMAVARPRKPVVLSVETTARGAWSPRGRR